MKKTMKNIAISSVLCFMLFTKLNAEDITEYNLRRARLMQKDCQHTVGSKLILTEREQLTNQKLMQWKNMDTDNSFSNPYYLNISGSYFTYRAAMKRSRVYQMIERMPKGAALHVHSTLMLPAEDLIKFTYDDNVYVCVTDYDLIFHFSDTTPTRPCPVQWTLANKLRKEHANASQFDALLKERLTLGTEDRILNSNENEVWKVFTNTIATILSLEEYRPVRERMIYQSLQNLYDDNVLYVELRLGLHTLYELNGTVHDKMYMPSLFKQVVRKFMDANPDFAGVKLIICSSRRSVKTTEDGLNLARDVKQIQPDLFAGFDLVGQEDQGKPLTEFLPFLLEAKDEIDYFFHAGETNQYGTSVDENLFDAILLGSKRIGHGNALIKHPALIDAVRQNDIAIEVNVISNSVLSLVQDVRNHPLASYLALGLPVVLSSDDPGVWGAKPLSDDFYVAFVGVASRHADLRMLKQLAINSIRYSVLDDRGKTTLFRTFGRRWSEFIDYINEV